VHREICVSTCGCSVTWELVADDEPYLTPLNPELPELPEDAVYEFDDLPTAATVVGLRLPPQVDARNKQSSQ
jgi:hypothetical protein